jgi:HEAT repeat protein
MLKDVDIDVRRQAVSLLGEWAGSDPEVLRLLIDALKDPDNFTPLPSLLGAFGRQLGLEASSVQHEVGLALLRAGPAARAAVPDLKKLLASENTSERSLAATILGEIGPDAKEAVPALLKLLKEERSVRIAAAEALSRLDTSVVETIPILIDALNDEFPGISLQGGARDALRRFGKPTVSALVALLRDREPGPQVADGLGITASLEAVRRAVLAAEVLGQIGGDAAEAVPILLEAVSDRRHERDPSTGSLALRMAAATALGKIGPKATDAKQTLSRIGRDGTEPPALRLAAAEGLWRIAREAQPSGDILVELLHGTLVVPVLQPEAFEFLAELKPIPDRAPQLLAASLKSRGTAPIWDRTSVAELLGKLGAAAAPAVPALRDASGDSSLRTRSAAAFALWQIERKGGADAARALVEELRDLSGLTPDFANRRQEVVKQLGALGRIAAPAQPLLKQLLDDHDREIREAAASALKKID